MFTRLNPLLMTYLDLMFGAGTSFWCLPLCWTLLFSWKRTHMHTISFHYQLMDTFKTNSYITGSKCHIKPGLSNYNPHPDGTAWRAWDTGKRHNVCMPNKTDYRLWWRLITMHAFPAVFPHHAFSTSESLSEDYFVRASSYTDAGQTANGRRTGLCKNAACVLQQLIWRYINKTAWNTVLIWCVSVLKMRMWDSMTHDCRPKLPTGKIK